MVWANSEDPDQTVSVGLHCFAILSASFEHIKQQFQFRMIKQQFFMDPGVFVNYYFVWFEVLRPSQHY